MNKIIKNYINNIDKEDVRKFSIKNDILLSEKELEIVYNVIKKESDLLIDDHESVFLKYKDNFSELNYNKIYELFTIYKKRYKYYL